MKDIILTTLNARYIHTSIGLRYLFANLRDLKDSAEIIEFGINESITDCAEKLLKHKPRIIGIGVYIWNAREARQLAGILKKAAPEVIIVLGGPEVSHLPMRVDFSHADHIIMGEAETAFYLLCRDLLKEEKLPAERLIKSEAADLDKIELPYKYYSDSDIKNRIIYVEASRGCPFMCEFCLSSLDKTVRYFDNDLFLGEIETLWQRGARQFKFIDRTFNINQNVANRILDYFLEKKDKFFIHFEVIPDHMAEGMKKRLKLFQPGSVQLEIGIQTLNADTAELINRKLDFEKIKENLHFLQNSTNVHLHVDLIIGLPGETVESFGQNLNRLVSLTNSEIQIGILKKLSGTTISRHDEIYGMVYSDEPPYEILKNDLIPFEMMVKMKRFARFWDLAYNSGNFKNTIHFVWDKGDAFGGFFSFSEWLIEQTESTWQISLLRLTELVYRYLTEYMKKDKTLTADLMIADMLKTKDRVIPGFLKEYASEVSFRREAGDAPKANKRQLRHI